LKATPSGTYLSGSPIDSRSLFVDGVAVFQTTRLVPGVGLVGNFALGARLFVREQPRFEVNTQGGEAEWKSNKVLLRAEERLALAVVYPEAFCTASFSS
jgi:hypothetical protein